MNLTTNARLLAIISTAWLWLFSPAWAEEKMDLSAYTLLDAEGKPVPMAQYRGMSVILHFWATWCTPCIEELPDIDALQRRNSQLLVLPISEDIDPAKVTAFYKAANIRHLPVLLDEKGKMLQALQLIGLPYTLLVNAQGEIIMRHPGVFKKWKDFSLPSSASGQ